MLHIIACDDEIEFLEILEMELEKRYTRPYTLLKTNDVDKLEEILQKDSVRYDILLMDIKMQMNNGIEFAARMMDYGHHLKVIFITGYIGEYYEAVFLELRPFGVLSKPVDWGNFTALLEKACIEEKKRRYLPLKIQSGIINVDLDDVYYFESIKRTTMIRMKEETQRIYSSLLDLAKSLPSNFLQCHKSFIVNMDYIESFLFHEIVMRDGSVVTVSKARVGTAKKEYFTYVGMGL